MLDHNLVLKNDELYSVGEIATDGSGERATGLYLRDTRHLNTFSVFLNGARPEMLSVRQHNAGRATVTAGNRAFDLAGGATVPRLCVMLQELISLDDGLRVTIRLQNFTQARVSLTLGLDFAADFRDLFDIRGFHRNARGTLAPPSFEAQALTLGYVGLDGALVETHIAFDRAPFEVATSEVDPGLSHVRASFTADLEPGAVWTLAVTVKPRPARGAGLANWSPNSMAGWTQTHLTTDHLEFNEVMDRCSADFDELQTRFPDGALPAAGIPWYVAPFGRDSLIVGLQTFHLAPERAIGTLRVLAALQGVRVDSAREEEPGKILHEMRYGEMARLREVPHSPYYGTADATPLWLWLFAETVKWTGDQTLFTELLPHALRALDWIERYGDLDGDGLVEYRNDAGEGGRISNQVWKDSFDSLNHSDGRAVVGPIAAVEVQGYVFAAYANLAGVASVFGEGVLAERLTRQAAATRELVESRFWLDDQGFYAQALDGAKRPVRSMSSNPGHLLAAGLPAPERAERVIEHFGQPDFRSGWGIRTLSANEVAYNPMSYHNGSVWPHDNSLIGAGMYRYGHSEAGETVASALFDAAKVEPHRRLPELYCGFTRVSADEDSPVPYPVSCTPQAWAAGALPLLLRAMLGLDVDLVNRTLLVKPMLPRWLNSVVLGDVRVLGLTGSLEFRRDGDRIVCNAIGLPVRVVDSPQA